MKRFGTKYGGFYYPQNLDGLNQTIDVMFKISNEVANSSQWPNWYEDNEFRSIRDLSRNSNEDY